LAYPDTESKPLLSMVPKFYSLFMIYAAMLAAILFAISIARIVFLNSEVEILDTAGEKLQRVIRPQEEKYPIDYTTPETIASSQEKLPEELQEEETEYAWATNASELKKEGRTLWWGLALLSVVAFVTAFIGFIRS
jgi:phosphoribosyl-ATP pyrophosphohydrolase